MFKKIKNLINKKSLTAEQQNSPTQQQNDNTKEEMLDIICYGDLEYIKNLMKPQIDALKENLDENSKKYVDFYIKSMLLFPWDIKQLDGSKMKFLNKSLFFLHILKFKNLKYLRFFKQFLIS